MIPMELLTITSLLFALLLTFHIVLFSSERIKRSGTLWHVVDYLWLAAAAVALVFAVLDVQRVRISHDIDRKRGEAKGELNQIRIHASHIVRYLGYTKDKDGSQKSIEWFKKLSRELEFGYENFGWRIFLAQNFNNLIPEKKADPGISVSLVERTNDQWAEYKIDPLNADPMVLKEAKLVVQDLYKVSEIDSEVRERESKLNSTDSSFRLQWPWLLSIALALRITKVTADLLKYRQAENRPFKKKDPHNSGSKEEVSVVSDAP